MDLINTTRPPNDYMPQQQIFLQPPPHREKTKRPQLSCNPCRARKVKCDRIQPCTACSLHQIADICHYDLSETERQPILQAEALKEKDKTIAQLRNDIALLRGDSVKSEPLEDEFPGFTRKMRLPPRSSKRLPTTEHSSVHGLKEDDSIYYGNPSVGNVVNELSHLSFDQIPASLSHAKPRPIDVSAFQMATSHPFPTLWCAKDDTSTLIKLLPPQQDLFFFLDAFQRRAQSCSFPDLPEECTANEVRRFLDNVEHNAAIHPEVLALLFATLAQGLQHGIYDKYGEKWVPGTVEPELKKGDVYIAAAMQCLRLGSFSNRPKLLVIETLVMISPYLTNTGKFLDGSALFGGTVRLAQMIGLHRDPKHLNPPAPPQEAATRKRLWWWMLHIDQQYSTMLGRPLAISGMGDCPPPEAILLGSAMQNLSDFTTQFSILGRQILATGCLSNAKIDRLTDELLTLHQKLPKALQFDVTWLDKDKPLSGWPLDSQAAILHSKMHNLLILLNRRRSDHSQADSVGTSINVSLATAANDKHGIGRGRQRVLESCRTLLLAFEFFHTRLRAGMMCWSMGQMAFNASMILTLSMLETGETLDLLAVQHAYSTFLEMNKLGIHKLAGAAVERLGTLMKEFQTEDSANETVMGQHGMILLEDPGLQCSLPETFAPLRFHMAGAIDDTGLGRSISQLGECENTTQPQRKKGRKSAASREGKMPKGTKRSVNKASRMHDRRYSDSMTPQPPSRRRINRSTPNLSLLTSLPGQSIFPTASTPAIKSEALFTPNAHHVFEDLPSSTYRNPNTRPLQANADLGEMNSIQSQGFSEHLQQMQQHHSLPSHHDISGHEDQAFDFSTQTTPYSSEFFDNSLSSATHGFEEHQLPYDHGPFSTSSFRIPDTGPFSPHF